jgi:signal transduction histidine kinase
VRSLSRLKQVYDEKVDLLTDVQEAYNRLAAAQGELIEVEKRKSQMEAMMTTAAGICHEMSQPLTSALITLQLLRQNGDPKISEDVYTIETSLLQARVILDKLRALTRYETKPYLGEELILDIDRSSETPALKNYNQEINGEQDTSLN